MAHQCQDSVLPTLCRVGFTTDITTDITTDMLCILQRVGVFSSIVIRRVQNHFECGNIVQDEFGRAVSVFLKGFLDHADSPAELVDITECLHGFGKDGIPIIVFIGEVFNPGFPEKVAGIVYFYPVAVFVEFDGALLPS